MRELLVALAAVTWAVFPSHATAAEVFVASDGNDSAAGTMQAPFATLERAQMAAAPGDTVWIRGGEYKFSGTTRTVGVSFTKSGAANKPINYFAYAAEIPIFDLFDVKPQERVTGLDVHCNWIHLRGLEVRGVRQLIVGDSWGVRIRGDHNVIERLVVHDNEAPGVFIASGASNLILNCDSHNNYDPLEQGGNGDGFGCHSAGGDNVLRGCRSWSNSDDGFDFINAPGTCTVEHSWSFKNGYVPDTMTAAGNGAGFKSGGFGSPPNIPSTGVPRHVVRFNLAFRNRSQGVYANHHPGGIDFLNNTAFANAVNYDMLVEGGQSTHQLHNCIAAGAGGTVMRFSGGDDSNNSWNLPVMVSAADFASMDESEVLAPRQADGSLPVIKLMHLVQGSDLIDRGMNVGLQFAGNSPDLGAFEFGADEGSAAADGGTADVGMKMDPSTAMLPSAGTAAAGSGANGPPGQVGQVGQAGQGTTGSGQVARASSAGMSGAATTPRTVAGAGALAAAGDGATGQTTAAATQSAASGSGRVPPSGCSCHVAGAVKTGRANRALFLLLPLAAVAAGLRLRTRRRRVRSRNVAS
jgi:hypothetical protein